MPIPQDLSTSVENLVREGSRLDRRRGVPDVRGEAAVTLARGVSTPHVHAVLLALFLLSSPLSCDHGGPYTPRVAGPTGVRPSRSDPRTEGRASHGQRQAHLPAEQPTPRPRPRLPPPHAYARRPVDPLVAPAQGPHAAGRLTC